MYSLVRYYIKTSLLFLVSGLFLGGYLIFLREIRGNYPDFMLITVHSHLLLIGFVMMMIMGVALWMFPRPRKDDKHYSPDLAKVVYWIMVFSILGRAGSELLKIWIESSILSWIITIGSFLEIGGIILFFLNIWTRIRPVGSHIREAKGEKF